MALYSVVYMILWLGSLNFCTVLLRMTAIPMPELDFDASVKIRVVCSFMSIKFLKKLLCVRLDISFFYIL